MYWYIEYPTDSGLQLTDDNCQLLIFSSLSLANARMEGHGQRGRVIGPKTAAALASIFCPHQKIVFVKESGEYLSKISSLA